MQDRTAERHPFHSCIACRSEDADCQAAVVSGSQSDDVVGAIVIINCIRLHEDMGWKGLDLIAMMKLDLCRAEGASFERTPCP